MNTTTPELRDYHRNGIAGTGFWVDSHADGLRIWWQRSDGTTPDLDTDPADAQIGWGALFVIGYAEPAWDRLRGIRTIGTNTFAIAFDDPAHGTFVAIRDITERGRCAVFALAKLPNVEFGVNSWRGDHYQAQIDNYRRTP